MTTLVVGATGATGKLLVEQLLQSGQKVKAVIRPTTLIPGSWHNNAAITIIKEEITKISLIEIARHLSDCQAAASCLGHHLNWKGLFGRPWALVATSVKLLNEAIAQNTPEQPVKFVLMNTAGNSNRDLDEPVPFGQKIIIALLRFLLPPLRDNEKAADYLRTLAGKKNGYMEWVVVRPDSLMDAQQVTPYSVYPSPTRNAIFNPGRTSRINVAHFMSKLITDDATWTKWKGHIPVMYNDTN